VIVDGQPCFDFDPADYTPQDIVTPQSRTFIPSRITDNPYLVNSGYMSVLQAMPEPLRSQMLYGNFAAGMEDDAFQVIPTAWVDRAMARWTDRSPKGEMTSMGVDVARGGKDSTTIASKHGNWYDKLLRLPGKSTPDGQTVVAQIVANRRNSAPVHVDGIGVGASVVDLARRADPDHQRERVGAQPVPRQSRQPALRQPAQRAVVAHARGAGPAVRHRHSCCRRTPSWPRSCARRSGACRARPSTCSREEIIDDIGRSPDAATAVILAQIETPNEAKVVRQAQQRQAAGYDPINAHAERAPISPSASYDPLAHF
jgi:hypothetical protein